MLAYDFGFAELQFSAQGMRKRLIFPPAELLGLDENSWHRPREDARLGFINFQPGDDGRVRSAQLILDSEGQRHVFFAGRVLPRGGSSDLLHREPDARLIRIAGGPGEAF